jgi:hypothetical protein
LFSFLNSKLFIFPKKLVVMKKLKLMLAFSGILAMQNLFAQTGAHIPLSDSLTAELKAKYPDGLLARKEFVLFNIEKDPAKKEVFL